MVGIWAKLKGQSRSCYHTDVCPRDVLASFLDSGRKLRHVVHLYIQSMVYTLVWPGGINIALLKDIPII